MLAFGLASSRRPCHRKRWTCRWWNIHVTTIFLWGVSERDRSTFCFPWCCCSSKFLFTGERISIRTKLYFDDYWSKHCQSIYFRKWSRMVESGQCFTLRQGLKEKLVFLSSRIVELMTLFDVLNHLSRNGAGLEPGNNVTMMKLGNRSPKWR